MVDSWPNFAPVEDRADWLPIRYWSYWDFALDFSVMEQGRVVVFLCPFLEAEDSYAPYFDTYELIGVDQPPEKFPRDWDDRAHSLTRLPIKAVTLDLTRKTFLRRDCLRTILTPASPTT